MCNSSSHHPETKAKLFFLLNQDYNQLKANIEDAMGQISGEWLLEKQNWWLLSILQMQLLPLYVLLNSKNMIISAENINLDLLYTFFSVQIIIGKEATVKYV